MAICGIFYEGWEVGGMGNEVVENIFIGEVVPTGFKLFLCIGVTMVKARGGRKGVEGWYGSK